MISHILPRRLHTLIYIVLAMVAAALLAVPAHADPEDIEASARGVVRVIVVGRDGDEVFPISHGSGFAVDSETIITNAHVVEAALEDPRLSIGLVPSNGGEPVYGRLLAVSPRNDLALVTTTTPMRLPPLTIAGNPPRNSGTVTAIGYPMNVDQAQGLGQEDIFRTQPPVTSQGFLAGSRPSLEFDTVLHTAPIARGNSGGPLVDNCGRVVGVNSFGAESEGTEAEFFFAVTMREMLPFLRANDITPRINTLPCRSLADLEEDEREREARIQMAAQLEAEADEQAIAQRRTEIRRDIEFTMMDERSNGMALSLLIFVVFMGGAVFAISAHRRGDFRARAFGGSLAMAALAGSAVAWFSRPSFNEVEARLETQLRDEMAAIDTGVIETPTAAGQLSCTLDTDRSRVLGAPVENLSLEWSEQGCVNGQTQYALSGDLWTRVLVPASEEAVSVNRYTPQSREYVVERFLLAGDDMTAARARRASYGAPACGADMQAITELGVRQSTILALLPDRPNERLVYNCDMNAGAPAGAAVGE